MLMDLVEFKVTAYSCQFWVSVHHMGIHTACMCACFARIIGILSAIQSHANSKVHMNTYILTTMCNQCSHVTSAVQLK